MTLHLGDCLDLLSTLEAGSVDAIIADLPYGTTACKWDAVIPFEPMWREFRRVTKPNAAIVLTASQPFTTTLIASNIKDFRYCWVWDKVNKCTGALNANRMPMKRHEDIAVFYQASPTYNKQPLMKPRIGGGKGGKFGKVYAGDETPRIGGSVRATIEDVPHNPVSILSIKAAGNNNQNGLHPTQKPVALMEYLIRTYTNEGEVVLDPTMGSGTTGVACVNTGRRFIGIERDAGYFAIAQRRITEAQNATPLLQAAE
jgi:site-specific DNA-methyltransferase (adenine-specific)